MFPIWVLDKGINLLSKMMTINLFPTDVPIKKKKNLENFMLNKINIKNKNTQRSGGST